MHVCRPKTNKGAWPRLLNEAFEANMTTGNIISGFRACGIFLFNANALRLAVTTTERALEEHLKRTEEKQAHQSSSETTQVPGTSQDGASLGFWLEAISLP